jgi:hypothetical protein
VDKVRSRKKILKQARSACSTRLDEEEGTKSMEYVFKMQMRWIQMTNTYLNTVTRHRHLQRHSIVFILLKIC